MPGFVANCQFTRFITGPYLWQNFGYPALLFLPFTAGSGSALLNFANFIQNITERFGGDRSPSLRRSLRLRRRERVGGTKGFPQTSFRIKQIGFKGGKGLAAISNGFRQITLEISCSKSKSIAGSLGFACKRSFIMLCTLHSTAYAIFFLQQLLFLHGSDLHGCTGKTCFSWVIPDRCKQVVTATEQGEVLRRCQFYKHFPNISAKVGLTLFLIVFFSLVFVKRYQFKTISVFLNDVIAKRFSPIFRCQTCCY